MVTIDTIVAYTLNGIVLGSILALAAIGLTLVYGILNLSNFAHGDYLTLGAYLAFLFNVTMPHEDSLQWALAIGLLLAGVALAAWVTKRWLSPSERIVCLVAGGVLLAFAAVQMLGVTAAPDFLRSPFMLAAVLSIVLLPLFAIGLDFAIWKPLRKKRATVLTLIIVSIGVALALRNLIALYFGSGLMSYARPVEPPVFIGGYILRQTQVYALITAAVLILAVHLFLRYTRAGKALRALSDNIELARVTGIDVDRMILYVWALAGGLAAIAGILLAMNVNLNVNLGWYIILPTFAAVILGGIGSAYGAMAGALVLGIAWELSTIWSSAYRPASAFIVLILVLLIRPQGIFGGKA